MFGNIRRFSLMGAFCRPGLYNLDVSQSGLLISDRDKTK